MGVRRPERHERARTHTQTHTHARAHQGVLYEIVYVDLNPERREAMLVGGNMRVLPQLHIDGVYKGDYDELQVGGGSGAGVVLLV